MRRLPTSLITLRKVDWGSIDLYQLCLCSIRVQNQLNLVAQAGSKKDSLFPIRVGFEISDGHTFAARGMNESVIAHINPNMGDELRRCVSIGEKNQIATSEIISIRDDSAITANFLRCAWQCMDACGLECCYDEARAIDSRM